MFCERQGRLIEKVKMVGKHWQTPLQSVLFCCFGCKGGGVFVLFEFLESVSVSLNSRLQPVRSHILRWGVVRLKFSLLIRQWAPDFRHRERERETDRERDGDRERQRERATERERGGLFPPRFFPPYKACYQGPNVLARRFNCSLALSTFFFIAGTTLISLTPEIDNPKL